LRLGQLFLDNEKKTLKELNYQTDSDPVIVKDGFFKFYHYTHENKLPKILSQDEGLYARRKVIAAKLPEVFQGTYLVEGFMSLLPLWLTSSLYYKNLGLKLTEQYIGEILLEVTIPIDEAQIYIADYAHVLECKLLENKDIPRIGLEYDCSNGRECTQAYVNSYIPIRDYQGQHHAPVVQVIRHGKGIVIPNKYIKICKVQPRKLIRDAGDIG
jgi:hypothetical protein